MRKCILISTLLVAAIITILACGPSPTFSQPAIVLQEKMVCSETSCYTLVYHPSSEACFILFRGRYGEGGLAEMPKLMCSIEIKPRE